MTGLEQALTILQRIANTKPPAGCDRCHGEPVVHRFDDQTGRPYAGRCDCALGRYLAAQDRANGWAA